MMRPDFSGNEGVVRQMIDDVSDSRNLFRTLHDFSHRLTKMHKELIDKEGQFVIMPGQAEQITAEYCESFIWAVIRTLEKAREATQGTGTASADLAEANSPSNPPISKNYNTPPEGKEE
jgi:hypothetical protein